MAAITDLSTASSVGTGDYLVISQGGTDKKVTANKFAIMGTAVHNTYVSDRQTATLLPNYGSYIELAPTVPAYSSQTFLLVIFAWDSINNNPFDQQLWMVSGTSGVYTAFKIGGGSNLIVTINSSKLRISNTHATTSANTTVDCVVIKA